MSSDQQRDHGRKRIRQGQRSQDGGRKEGRSTNDPHQESVVAPILTPPVAGAVNSPEMSFTTRIGLALQGADWQTLQNEALKPAPAPIPASAPTLAPVPAIEEVDELSDGYSEMGVEVTEGGVEAPKELTARQRQKMKRFIDTIARDTGEVLQVIQANALVPVPQEVTWNGDPDLLCCYNWKGTVDANNTIFVPGEPGKWHPPTLPYTLERDSGFSYNDYNYARQPRDPYTPMFHALGVMNPGYQFNDVDVLADRNPLRTLLEFTQGKSNGPFRLDLHLVSNTLVILRKESRWWKHSDGVGYGCNFEKVFTRPAEGMEDAANHYRAIRYPMGPLNVVCRFEADSWDDGLVSDELSQSEAAVVNDSPAERSKFEYRAPFRVLQKGHIVPSSQMVELKTQRHDLFKQVACQDQLWFGRTKLLFTGPYELKTGVFNYIKKEDATERVKKWEKTNQESLRKLVTLLTELRSVLKRERGPNRAVVLVREDKAGPLSVRSMTAMQYAVRREFFQRHWRTGPMPPQQFNGHRGQRGGRAMSYGSRGRGHPSAHGQPHPYSQPHPHVQPYNPGQPFNAHGPSHTNRGRGSSDKGGGPNYERGAFGGRGRGQDRGRAQGRGRLGPYN